MPTEPAMRHERDPNHSLLIEMLERYERPLIRYALTIIDDLDQARDIAQDVFIKLSQNLKTLDHSKLAPWLFTVCKNRALDHRRKHQRIIPMDTALLDQHSSHTPAPSASLEANELSQQLLQWMSELPEKQREAVRLKFQSGLNYKEISDILHTSTGNVGTLIHLGITHLRERWLALNA